MNPLPCPLGFRVALAALALGFCGGLRVSAAETARLWTDTQGRTVRATLLERTERTVKIRREDGQVFTFEIEKLSAADRDYLAAVAQAAAAARPVKIELKWSRGQFEVERSGTGADSAVIESTEHWGYAVTVQNLDSAPSPELRIDYALFVQPDVEPGRDRVKPDLRHQLGSKTLGSLGLRGMETFRTEPIVIMRQQLKAGWRWSKTGTREGMRDTLEGIWVRVYRGDELVLERASSESLKRDGWPLTSDY